MQFTCSFFFSRPQICFLSFYYLPFELLPYFLHFEINQSLNHLDHLFLKNISHRFLFLVFVVFSFQESNLLSRIRWSSRIVFFCTSCFFDVDFHWKGMDYLLRVVYKKVKLHTFCQHIQKFQAKQALLVMVFKAKTVYYSSKSE